MDPTGLQIELVKKNTTASVTSLIKTYFYHLTERLYRLTLPTEKDRYRSSHLAYPFKTCHREDVPNIQLDVNKDRVLDSCFISALLIHLIKY